MKCAVQRLHSIKMSVGAFDAANNWREIINVYEQQQTCLQKSTNFNKIEINVYFHFVFQIARLSVDRFFLVSENSRSIENDHLPFQQQKITVY